MSHSKTSNYKTKSVKLRLYHNVGEKTYIDTMEAESFDKFVLVYIDDSDINQLPNELMDQFSQMFSDKQVVIIPKSWDLSFYGIEVEEDDRSTDS